MQDSLFDVTLDNSYGGCTDSRDKLFAMMSMATGRDAYDWEVSLDYTLTAEDLYKRFAIWDMIRNRTLRVLSCASTTSQDPELMPSLPSWVPDWTRILNRQLLIRANATSMFSAGMSKDMVVWFSNDKSLVHVEGAVIDSIEVVGSEPCSVKTTSLFEIDKLTLDRFKSLYLWLAECWYIARNGHQMTPGTYDAFWRTMLCGLDSTGHPAWRSQDRLFPGVSTDKLPQSEYFQKDSSAVRKTFIYGSRRIFKSALLLKTLCRSGEQANGSVARSQVV